jgi:hypothetical protein
MEEDVLMTVLQYLRRELGGTGASAFIGEWRVLSDEDKTDLKQWAKEEMKLLGIEIKQG